MKSFLIAVMFLVACGPGKNGKDGAPGKNGINGIDGKNGVDGIDNRIVLTKNCTLSPSTGFLSGDSLRYSVSKMNSGDVFVSVFLNARSNFNISNSVFYSKAQNGANDEGITLSVDGYNWLNIFTSGSSSISVVVNSTNGNGGTYSVTGCTVQNY